MKNPATNRDVCDGCLPALRPAAASLSFFLFAGLVIPAASAFAAAAPVPRAVPALQEAPAGDIIHHLVEMDGRRRIKPFDLLRTSSGEYPSERLIFQDTATGSTLWKMSRNPGYNSHQYSNILVWNADGSALLLISTRPSTGRYWLVAADGGRWKPFPHQASGWVYWSETDPNKIWFDSGHGGGGNGEEHRSRGEAEAKDPGNMIFEADLATGQTRKLWDLSAEKGALKLFRPSSDGKKFLVRELNAADGGQHALAMVLNSDGTGEPQRIDLGVEAGQMWFLKRNDYSFAFNGYISDPNRFLLREWICEPSRQGAIRVIDPVSLFDHMGASPAGTRVAYRGKEGPGIWIRNVETGMAFEAVSYRRQVAQIGGGHLSWECDDRWFVASAGNAIYEVWVDDGRTRAICVPNTQHNRQTECEPESSPDGTKLIFNSTLLGDCDAYVAVQRLPEPPRNLRREGRVLTWDPPEHHREIAGYSLYRGSQLVDLRLIATCRCELPDDNGSYTVVAVEWSGLQSPCPDHEAPPAPAGLVVTARSPFVTALAWQPSPANDVSYYNVYCSTQPNPVPLQQNRIASPAATGALDWGLQADTSYYYVLTAVDRAGNESAPSAPVSVRTPGIQRVLQRVSEGRQLDRAPLAVPVNVPRDGRYLLWVELKAGKVSSEQKLGVSIDGVRYPSSTPWWEYVSVGWEEPAATPFSDTLKSDGSCNPWYDLKAGQHMVTLSLPDGFAELVSVTVTNDAGFLPEGVTRYRYESAGARNTTHRQ